MGGNSTSTRAPQKYGAGLFFAILAAPAFLLGGMPILHAEEAPAKTGIALPGEPCRVAPRPGWSKQERWVWQHVCEGKEANFNTAKGYGGELDPRGWPKSRKLRSVFLQTILLNEPFRSALPRQGVRIIGAWFAEPIDLNGARIGHELWLNKSRFDKNVDLSRLRSDSLLSLSGSTFDGKLDMDSLQVAGNLLIRDGARFKNVNLINASIGGTLDMDGSTFAGELNMDSLRVGKHLFMRSDATFNNKIVLSSANIGGQVSMIGSTFDGKLNMNSLRVVGSLLMRGGAKFKEVELISANIGGTLDMVGSTFDGELDMDSLRAGKHLFMKSGATFNKKVVLSSANIGGQMSMIGSTFDGKLDMNSLRVAGSLLMRGGAKFKEVELISANIGGTLDMTGSTFDGKLDMNSLRVAGSLLMRDGAKFKEVELIGAGIGGQVSMIGSTFDGKLDMNSLQVASSLLMHKGAKFKEVELSNASIGGTLAMDNSTFDGKLDMDSLQVGGNLFIRGTTIQNGGPVNLIFAKIGNNLDISGSKLPTLDLTGATIKEEFRFDVPPIWKEASSLNLRNTSVGELQDHEYSWPDKLELDGFVYKRLGGYTNSDADSMADRSKDWLSAWLKKQDHYSPQPYTQLAAILKQSGHPIMAKEILYLSYDRERAETANGTHWLWLWMKKVLIGYGYKIWYSIFWILLFVAAGSLVFRSSKEAKENGMPYGIAYSLDMLLPIIKLREKHYKIDLSGWQRYYFFFHMVMGYVLASFLIAGMSGMTG